MSDDLTLGRIQYGWTYHTASGTAIPPATPPVTRSVKPEGTQTECANFRGIDAAGVAGDWMNVHSGIRFHPLAPRPEDIRLDDIAHALAHQCRYGGHCGSFYSVAQHSVLVAGLLPPALQLAGLLHDAAEAYLGDLIRPLKCAPFGQDYLRHEDRLLRAIAARFGFPFPFPDEIKHADNVVLFTEKRDLLPNVREDWPREAAYRDQLLPDRIVPWGPEVAKAGFLECFAMLQPESTR